MPGPWSDEMRSLSQCSLAPAAVAEDSERRGWGGSDVSREAPNPFPAQSTPSPVSHEVMPVAQAGCFGSRETRPVEARSKGKIAPPESGLRRSRIRHRRISNCHLPRRSHPGKNSCRTGESTTPRHLVFACESRLQHEGLLLKGESTVCLWEGCGIRDFLWIALENPDRESGMWNAQTKRARFSSRPLSSIRVHPRPSAKIRGSNSPSAGASSASPRHPYSPDSTRVISYSE